MQDRTDNPLRSSKRLTSASHDPWKDHARHRERVPAMILRPRSILGTIFSSRCQISRVHRPHEIRAHATRSCLFDMTTVTNLFCTDEHLSPDWWSQTGSNRRPPACKAGALPAELWPLSSVCAFGSCGFRRQPSFSVGLPPEAAEQRRLVGLGRLELPTSRLSSARSNQLSYKP